MLQSIVEPADLVSWVQLEPGLQMALQSKPFFSWQIKDNVHWALFFRLDGGYLLRFPDYADFRVSYDGLEVTCTATPHVGPATLSHLYLNQVVPLALSQQGRLVFHASAVDLDGRAVAFLGHSGRGKSTLAASFGTNGVGFLTDDVLLLRQDKTDTCPRVVPSLASVRLWRDSTEAIIPDSVSADPRVQFTTKDRFACGPDLLFNGCERKLRCAYILGETDTAVVTISPMSKAEALDAWLKHSFALDREDVSATARLFDRVAELTRTVPIFHLNYPRRFEYLDEVRAAILSDVRLQS